MSGFDDGFWWGVVFVLAVALVLVVIAASTDATLIFTKE